MKIIDRHLLHHMAGPFAFGVLAFVLLFVSANILFRLTELVSELGLSLWTAGELFLLWLPGFVVLTFPLATLVAILVAFGRMSGDSELVAMYAGGISFRRLVVPVACAGAILSIAFYPARVHALPRSPWRLPPVGVVADERVQLDGLAALRIRAWPPVAPAPLQPAGQGASRARACCGRPRGSGADAPSLRTSARRPSRRQPSCSTRLPGPAASRHCPGPTPPDALASAGTPGSPPPPRPGAPARAARQPWLMRRPNTGPIRGCSRCHRKLETILDRTAGGGTIRTATCPWPDSIYPLGRSR